MGAPLLRDLAGLLPWSRAHRHPYRDIRTLDPSPNRARVGAALRDLRDIFPRLENLSVARSWGGYIDFTPDMIPVLGAAPSPRGFIFATGLSGYGFGFGPIVGRLIAELIIDGKPSFDISGFRFERFTDGTIRGPRNVL